MDLIDQLQQIASRIEKQLGHLQTEEATKNALIMPMINALGYNVFDPTEVVPEFTADVGMKKGEKVDYAIMREGKPAILVECKTAGSKLNLSHASQLFRYFHATDARFAVLTNGIEYQFFTDIESPNKMDEKPFFEFSMANLDPKVVEEVKKFSKAHFNLENILSNASELKYKKQIRGLLAREYEAPTDEFVKHFTKQVYSGPFTAGIKEQFTKLVHDAFTDFVKERVNARLQHAMDGPVPTITNISVPEPAAAPTQDEEDPDIVTTPEEIEGFHIVRAILSKFVEPKRIVMRDTKSYCGVLLDDNNRKPLCRLRFNFSQKYICLMDADKNEDRHPIAAPSDIYKFEARLIQTLGYYVSGIGGEKSAASTSSEAPPEPVG